MKINLSKKNYVISAGADGLGFAIANKIINSGGKVHLSDINKSKIDKINANKFSDADFENVSSNKSLFKNIELNSVKDNNFFEINSVEYIYSLPEKSFLLALSLIHI